MEDILERVGVASSPNHVEVATVSGLASVSKAYVCGGCFAGTGTGAGAAGLARASKQKAAIRQLFYPVEMGGLSIAFRAS